MRVRDWREVVAEVIERDVDPMGWRAVGGARARGVGEDIYFGHPRAGLYHVKTYAKNPFEVRGVGARIARRLDDEIGSFLPEKEEAGRFAIQAGFEGNERDLERKANHLEETLKAHADAPTTEADLFDDVMNVLESPAYGPMTFDRYDRPDPLSGMTDAFEEAEELLDAELDDLIDDDGVGRGFQ